MLSQYTGIVILISTWVVCFKLSSRKFLLMLVKMFLYFVPLQNGCFSLKPLSPKKKSIEFCLHRKLKKKKQWAVQSYSAARQYELTLLPHGMSVYMRWKNTLMVLSALSSRCGQKTNPGTEYLCPPGPAWNIGNLTTDLYLFSKAGLCKSTIYKCILECHDVPYFTVQID